MGLIGTLCWKITKIYFKHGRAGLGDRFTLILELAQLTGYRCARLYLPAPQHVLTPDHHNGGIEIDPWVHWWDFLNLTCVQDSSPVIDISPAPDTATHCNRHSCLQKQYYARLLLWIDARGQQGLQYIKGLCPAPRFLVAAVREFNKVFFWRYRSRSISNLPAELGTTQHISSNYLPTMRPFSWIVQHPPRR
jgi:hypothetical protein